MKIPRKSDVALPVSVMLCMHTLIALAVFIVPVMAPEMGLNANDIGTFVFLLYLTSMITVPFSGPCTARFGPMRMMQICVFCCAIGVALCCGFYSEIRSLGAICIGTGLGLATPAASDILLRYSPVSIRSFVFSLKQAAVPAGNLIAGLLVLLAIAIGWQNAFLIIAILTGAVALIFQPLQRTWDTGRDTAAHVTFNLKSFVSGVRIIFADQRLRWLSISSFAFVLLQIATTSYLVTFLVTKVGCDHKTAGVIYALSFAGGFFSRIIFGIIADNLISPLKTLGLLGFIMGGASLITAQFTPDWPVYGITITSFVLASTAAGWNGVYIAETAARAPAGLASHVLGISLIMTYAGCIATTPLFLILLSLSRDSYHVAFSLFAVPAILTGLRLLSIERKQV